MQIFAFEEKEEIRTLLINDEPYFVGKDVAEVLGYSNASKAVMNHVDLEDKKFEMIAHSQNGNASETKTAVINESGLYSLILKSKLPSAKKFKRWVTSEVLPTIRKHGMYATEELLNNPDLLIQVATQLKEERTKRLIAEQQVKELKPKADYYDTILANPSLLPISVIAKNYGMSANKMNQLLHDLKVQYKQGDVWLLYADYQNEGYTHTEMKLWEGSSRMKPNTKWTQKGHIFIYQFLKKHDVYPSIETLFE
jgi:prophage antirepressor-like protein